jgi:8-oxo-dGTP diphosphatase
MKTVHVVAAVIRNAQGEILLAQRLAYAHQGGLWEFPGGKREPGESPEQALRRELIEELALQADAMRPLIQIKHDYGDKHILLDVWDVETWSGQPWGREGQVVNWRADLSALAFPAANEPVLKAVQLPELYTITPEPGANFWAELADFIARHHRSSLSLGNPPPLLQFRAKNLTPADYRTYAHTLLSYPLRVMLNAAPELVEQLGASGCHLDSRRLWAYQQRPLADKYLLSASCHNAADIQQARQLGADFIVLSPVRATASHPDATPLGWLRFAALVQDCRCPVYALGGMERKHLALAWAHGAQGIAAIRGIWADGA